MTGKSWLDLGQFEGLVFVNLTKAFDTVDHEILCLKLEHYVVNNEDLSWFTSHFSGHKQFLRVNEIYSKVRDIKYWCTTGAHVLAPYFSSSLSMTSHRLPKIQWYL